MVYIAEAHALDGVWPMMGRGTPVVEEPITLEERLAVAGKCVTGLELKAMPAVVDLLDDAVNGIWQAWPDRLYLVGKAGKVVFAGGRGPRGFRPEQLETAIKRELGEEKDPEGPVGS